jgi:hypothetical protein
MHRFESRKNRMPIDPREDPPIKPGQPSEPPQESPPGNPRPEVPPPMQEPGAPPPPDELPGHMPDELPVRGPDDPRTPSPAPGPPTYRSETSHQSADARHAAGDNAKLRFEMMA